MTQKTNAVRQLDQNKIPYELRTYTVDESDLSASTVAAKINFPLPRVYKTLVARGDKTGVLLACIPGDKELDLKALASLSSNKKVEVVPLKDVQPLTGYIRGGVSPLGLKKKYPFFLEEAALSFDTISISAGVRGCQVLLNPQHLVSLTRAACGSISKNA